MTITMTTREFLERYAEGMAPDDPRRATIARWLADDQEFADTCNLIALIVAAHPELLDFIQGAAEELQDQAEVLTSLRLSGRTN